MGWCDGVWSFCGVVEKRCEGVFRGVLNGDVRVLVARRRRLTDTGASGNLKVSCWREEVDFGVGGGFEWSYLELDVFTACF